MDSVHKMRVRHLIRSTKQHYQRWLFALLISAFDSHALADGSGPISTMHYSVFDQNQSNAICFQVAGTWLAFISNGSEEHKAVTATLIGAFYSGKTVNFSAGTTPLNPAPCQSWDIPGPVYALNAISVY